MAQQDDSRICARCRCPWHGTNQCGGFAHAPNVCASAITPELLMCELLNDACGLLVGVQQLLAALAKTDNRIITP